MRKLDLQNYDIEVMNEKGEFEKVPYNFKYSLKKIMFHPIQQLTGLPLLENHIIAKKIMEADKDVLLEEAEYQKIRMAVLDRYTGYSENEVQLVERVRDCPEVDVKEKKK